MTPSKTSEDKKTVVVTSTSVEEMRKRAADRLAEEQRVRAQREATEAKERDAKMAAQKKAE